MFFNFDSVLFWYKILFMAEIITAAVIFSLNLRRRDHFAVRVACSAAGLFLIAFLYPIVAYNALWICFMFFMMFLALLCAMKICFNERWWNILFCGLAAYTIQHIAFVIFDSFSDLSALLFGLDINSNVYAEDNVVTGGLPFIVMTVVYLVSYFVVYLIAYFAYADKIRPDEASKLGRTRFIVLAAMIIVTDNIFNAITMYNAGIDKISLWIERGYNVFTCLLSLQLQFSQLTEKNIETKYDAVQHILREEQKQYMLVKQNLDTVNIKCHDMKHQLRRMRLGGVELGNDEIDEIEKVLSVYDSVVKTGNDTLDLILAEKNLMHSSKDIVITCIADGKLLDFITPTDMYSLFGNALDNAIEAVSELEISKRNISLFVKRVGNMLSVHIENYYDGERLIDENGLPKTTKSDEIYHGFGMLSMRTITEKYGGTLAFEADGNIFSLNIMFPAPSPDVAFGSD